MKENLYWLILALALALLLWVAPKANATPLQDFLDKHNLEFPQEVKEQMLKQDLVPAAGVLNEKERTFTVYFTKKPEGEVQEFDISTALMQVRFHLTKKKIEVAYLYWRIKSHPAKSWPNGNEELILVFLTLYPL